MSETFRNALGENEYVSVLLEAASAVSIGPDIKFYGDQRLDKVRLQDRTVDMGAPPRPLPDASRCCIDCGCAPGRCPYAVATTGLAKEAVADTAGGGKKADTGKATFDLLPWGAMAEVQRVLDFGAEKYGPWNWYKGMKWRRLWNACFRHMTAWVMGQDNDEETGISHLAHAICCLLFLLTFVLEKRGEDDRRKR